MSLSLTILISGCVPVDSLNPLYTDSNVIFEPGLLGRWAGSEPDEGLRFDRAENNAYQIIMTEKKNSDWLKQSVYQAHLVSLGGEKYLDVEPKELEGSPEQFLFQMDTAKKGSRFAPALQRVSLGVYLEMIGPTPGKATVQELQVKLRPAHWIFKVELHDKSLSLAYLDDEWVKKAIQKKLIQASHLKARDDNQIAWVLTGSTAEIQQLVVHTADDPGAFNAGMALSRVEAPALTPAPKEPGNP
jgi:hypothetical protein